MTETEFKGDAKYKNNLLRDSWYRDLPLTEKNLYIPGCQLHITWCHIHISFHLVCLDGYSSLDLEEEEAFSGRWTYHFLFLTVRILLICSPLAILLPDSQFSPVMPSPSSIFTVCSSRKNSSHAH